MAKKLPRREVTGRPAATPAAGGAGQPLQCVEMNGSDRRLDHDGYYFHPAANSWPEQCPRCHVPDLDATPEPYLLSKGIANPDELAPADAGNFLVRPRLRAILEAVAPGQCRFIPTQEQHTGKPTPWSLAVPLHRVDTGTAKAKIARCPACGQPRTAHPGTQLEGWQHSPRAAADVAKSASPHTLEEKVDTPPADSGAWMRLGLDHFRYFSVRLETLLKRLKLKGLRRSCFCPEKPTDADLAWVERQLETVARLPAEGAAAPGADAGAPSAAAWFAAYLEQHAKRSAPTWDFAALEQRHGVKLPADYQAFVSRIGAKTYRGLGGEEGFTATILLPARLDFASHRQAAGGAAEAIDGVAFARTGHGDEFCFDVRGAAKGGADYPVYLYDHEQERFEAYAPSFATCVRRWVERR